MADHPSWAEVHLNLTEAACSHGVAAVRTRLAAWSEGSRRGTIVERAPGHRPTSGTATSGTATSGTVSGSTASGGTAGGGTFGGMGSGTASGMASGMASGIASGIASSTACGERGATDYREGCSLLWVQIDQKHGIPPTVPYSQYKALASQWGEWQRANFATAAAVLLEQLRSGSSDRVVSKLDDHSPNGSGDRGIRRLDCPSSPASANGSGRVIGREGTDTKQPEEGRAESVSAPLVSPAATRAPPRAPRREAACIGAISCEAACIGAISAPGGAPSLCGGAHLTSRALLGPARYWAW